MEKGYNFDKTILIDVHFDGINHFLGPATTQGQRKMCKKNTRSMCTKCNIRLHGERGKTCFKTYHTRCQCVNTYKTYFSHNVSVSVTFKGKTYNSKNEIYSKN